MKSTENKQPKGVRELRCSKFSIGWLELSTGVNSNNKNS